MGRQSLQHGASLPNIPEFSAASVVAFFLLTVSRYIYISGWFSSEEIGLKVLLPPWIL